MHFQIRANCSRVLPLSEKPSMQKPLIVHEEKMQNLTQEDLSPDLNSRPPLHEADVLTSQSVTVPPSPDMNYFAEAPFGSCLETKCYRFSYFFGI